MNSEPFARNIPRICCRRQVPLTVSCYQHVSSTCYHQLKSAIKGEKRNALGAMRDDNCAVCFIEEEEESRMS